MSHKKRDNRCRVGAERGANPPKASETKEGEGGREATLRQRAPFPNSRRSIFDDGVAAE